MTRNHIHLAQGVPGTSVVSGMSYLYCKVPRLPSTVGMRNSSQILIFIDLQKALDAGLQFHLSDNGVVLTEGDENGYLSPQFFQRVEYTNRVPIPGWEGSGHVSPFAHRVAEAHVPRVAPTLPGQGASEQRVPALAGVTEPSSTNTPPS